jgi:hypothetical protein
MPLTMDITPTAATTMMDRGSISVDIITPPAVSEIEKPGFKPGFFFVQETASFFATSTRAALSALNNIFQKFKPRTVRESGPLPRGWDPLKNVISWIWDPLKPYGPRRVLVPSETSRTL